MRVVWGDYLPGEGIQLGDYYLCKNIYHITVSVPAPKFLGDNVFRTAKSSIQQEDSIH